MISYQNLTKSYFIFKKNLLMYELLSSYVIFNLLILEKI